MRRLILSAIVLSGCGAPSKYIHKEYELLQYEKLFELRVKHGSNICRLFYFYFRNNIYIVTSGYLKKDQKFDPVHQVACHDRYRSLSNLSKDRVLNPDGQISWHRWTNRAIFDHQNQQKEFQSVGMDITERVRAEKALMKSEERFRNLTETTSDWIWEVDKNAVYTYVSPKIYDILGYREEEIIGKTPFDLMSSDEADRVFRIFNNIRNSQKPFDCLENTNLHKNGHLVVLETSGVPTFDEKGAFSGYRGVDGGDV